MESTGTAVSVEIQRLIKLGQEKANSMTSNLIEYKCKACKDTGIVDRMVDGKHYAEHCACYKTKQMQRRLKNSGLTEVFQEMKFKNTECWNKSVKVCLEKAQDYVQRFDEDCKERDNSMLILGQVGSGKTRIAIAAANALMQEDIAVMYIHFKELMRGLKGDCLDEEAYNKRLYRLVSIPVLLIDDLFKGYTQADIKYTYDVINERYMRNKPVIVTSELMLKQLLEIDEAIASRLVEMSASHIHIFPNELRYNYRLRSLVDAE